jgi:hypothetical protein
VEPLRLNVRVHCAATGATRNPHAGENQKQGGNGGCAGWTGGAGALCAKECAQRSFDRSVVVTLCVLLAAVRVPRPERDGGATAGQQRRGEESKANRSERTAISDGRAHTAGTVCHLCPRLLACSALLCPVLKRAVLCLFALHAAQPPPPAQGPHCAFATGHVDIHTHTYALCERRCPQCPLRAVPPMSLHTTLRPLPLPVPAPRRRQQRGSSTAAAKKEQWGMKWTGKGSCCYLCN